MFIRSGYSAQTRRRSATEDHHLGGHVLGRLGDVTQLLGVQAVRGGLLGQAAGRDDLQLDQVVRSLALAVGADPLADRSIATRSSSTWMAIGWEKYVQPSAWPMSGAGSGGCPS